MFKSFDDVNATDLFYKNCMHIIIGTNSYIGRMYFGHYIMIVHACAYGFVYMSLYLHNYFMSTKDTHDRE